MIHTNFTKNQYFQVYSHRKISYMTNKIPLYQLVLIIFLAFGTLVFISNYTMQNISSQVNLMGSIIVIIGGILGFYEYKVARWILSAGILVFIGSLMYQIYDKLANPKWLSFTDLAITTNGSGIFILTSLLAIIFHQNTHPDSPTFLPKSFTNAIYIPTIFGFTFIGVGFSMFIGSFFPNSDFTTKNLVLNERIYDLLFVAIGVLTMLYWKVMRWVLSIILALLTILTLYNASQEMDKIGQRDILNIIIAIVILGSFILMFFNEYLLKHPQNINTSIPNDDILDDQEIQKS